MKYDCCRSFGYHACYKVLEKKGLTNSSLQKVVRSRVLLALGWPKKQLSPERVVVKFHDRGQKKA